MAKPKLCLIPAAQGSKLYSVLPSSGVGDFDFTRDTIATRINSQGLIETVASGVSRLNYQMIDGVVKGCPHHILEPLRTNLIPYSEDFSQWFKNNSPTITTNIAIAPDGTISADGIQSLTVGYKSVSQTIVITPNSTVTASFFVKKETSETFFGGFSIVFQNGTTKVLYVIVDAVNGTGTIAQSSLTGNIKVEDYGNYWRISATTTDNGGNTNCRLSYESTLSKNGTTLSDGAGSVRTLWGAQLEVGSYPTSYIPNYGTAAGVTRSAETATGSGDAATFNSEQGVLMVETSFVDDISFKGISISSGANGNCIRIYTSVNTDNSLVFRVTVNSVDQVLKLYTLNDASLYNKISIKYKENDFNVFINGFKLLTDNIGSTFSSGVLNQLNFNRSDGLDPFYGSTKQIQYFDTALTDSELEQLTSWVSFTDMANGQLYTIE